MDSLMNFSQQTNPCHPHLNQEIEHYCQRAPVPARIPSQSLPLHFSLHVTPSAFMSQIRFACSSSFLNRSIQYVFVLSGLYSQCPLVRSPVLCGAVFCPHCFIVSHYLQVHSTADVGCFWVFGDHEWCCCGHSHACFWVSFSMKLFLLVYPGDDITGSVRACDFISRRFG